MKTTVAPHNILFPAIPVPEHHSPLQILILAPQPFFQERGTPIAVRCLAEELAKELNGRALQDVHDLKEPTKLLTAAGKPAPTGARPPSSRRWTRPAAPYGRPGAGSGPKAWIPSPRQA